MQSDFKDNISKLENIFEIKILNPKNFQRALTHTSYTRENNINYIESYERLEFLGDAVLKLCVSDILFEMFPNYAEGQMTKIRSIIVSDNTLAEISINIGLNSIIQLGKVEEKCGGRDKISIIACAFEAILGAYYLAGNFSEISNFLKKHLISKIKSVDEHFEQFNAKAALQEYTQSQTKQLPVYKIIEEKGPEHDKIFVSQVDYLGKIISKGEGKTKKDAEQDAAYRACLELGAIKKED